MLHENPSMTDIDVNHWRNLQSLLLESAKERRRIIVIHEAGSILKFVHSHRAEIRRDLDRVDDPRTVAERVYRANADKVDFVAVFERQAFDKYFGQIQGTWRADEDLDAFVHRTYAILDEYPDGIVTFPGPARSTLGLQWRLGASYEVVQAAVGRLVSPESTVVLGVFDGDALWATLILGFDADRRVTLVTTADPSQLRLDGDKEEIVDEVVGWVNARFGSCSLALFSDLEGAREFLAAADKGQAFARLVSKGSVWSGPLPGGLKQQIALSTAS
jgi:hypothetical protein